MAPVNLLTILSTGLTLVAALLWQDAISSAINRYFPNNEKAAVWVKLLAAFVVSVLVILLLILIVHLTKYTPHLRWLSVDI